MHRVIFSITIMIASSVTAGEIVWRSPTSGTLAAISEPEPLPSEPGQPAFGIRYEQTSVSAGTAVIIKPVGDVTGFTFSIDQTLPPGLTFDWKTGRIVGVSPVAGNHSIIVRAAKDGFSADLVVSLTVT